MIIDFQQHFDTDAAAKLLGLKRKTLERWRLYGGGPAYRKLGGRVLYTGADLNEFSERCRRNSTSESSGAA